MKQARTEHLSTRVGERLCANRKVGQPKTILSDVLAFPEKGDSNKTSVRASLKAPVTCAEEIRISPALVGSAKASGTADELSTMTVDSFRFGATDEARSITHARFEGSTLAETARDFPTFHVDEIILGKRLGKGGFSNVDEVRGVQHQNPLQTKTSGKIPIPSRLAPLGILGRSDTVARDNRESRLFIADHCYRRSGDSRYAVKRLRKEILDDNDRIVLGLCDLAVEVRFLSNLEHPNIIKLRAVSSADPFSKQYFLLLDRLYDTLEKRIGIWKSQHQRFYSIWGRLRDRRGRKRLDFYESRIEKAFDLSAAIEYLHSQNVIHRDIKPENIGFDVRGDIKIFDFGLSRELRTCLMREDGTFLFTKKTGSLRYMAPEIWWGSPYNSACDVYSFGIVLWQLISLKKPFSSTEWQHETHFAEAILRPGGRRPKMDGQWPLTLVRVLETSWTHDQHNRSTMKQMTKGLRDELVRLRSGDESDIPDHMRRRSTFIFEPKIRSFISSKSDASSVEFLDKSKQS